MNWTTETRNSLYSLISRLRKLLADSGAKEPYILFQHDSYHWNTDLLINLDIDEFEQLYSLADSVLTDEEKLLYLTKYTLAAIWRSWHTSFDLKCRKKL